MSVVEARNAIEALPLEHRASIARLFGLIWGAGFSAGLTRVQHPNPYADFRYSSYVPPPQGPRKCGPPPPPKRNR